MKKIITLLSTFLLSLTTLFAMPGFKSYIPDNAGTFIYYRDYSFNRESYIGLLKYDDSTYQIKYFAPADKKQKLLEKNIAIAFTINPKANNFEMTGEKILSAINQDSEDIDLLNYLHDFLYEFSSRRIKAGDITPQTEDYQMGDNFQENGYQIMQNYEQFGGKVTITYDLLVPFYNIKNITNEKGENVLECVSIGTITSQDDKTFDDFKGNNYTAKKIKSKKIKQAEEVVFSTDFASVKIDKNWTPVENSIYMLNDEAILFMADFNIPGTKDKQQVLLTSLRSFISGKDFTYTDFTSIEFLPKDSDSNIVKVSYKTFSPKTNSVIYVIRYIYQGKTVEDNYLLSLSVNENAYKNKKAYYDNIIKSFSIKN